MVVTRAAAAAANATQVAPESSHDSVESEPSSTTAVSFDGSSLNEFIWATPPQFEIDISLAPKQRYLEVSEHFREEVKSLPNIFDELVNDFAPRFCRTPLKTLARLLLRRLYDPEENEEITGISEATGMPIHFLVAFNSLLDLLMGCTSGGARVGDFTSPTADFRMLHFRTLDWGMNPLRKIVVELNYVLKPGGDPVFRCLTYFGYVGVLTGVRKGLSLSLNFRPHHDQQTLAKRLGFRWHQLLVLTGRRRSISSTLRQTLMQPGPLDADTNAEKREHETADYDEWFLKQVLPGLVTCKSTAAYLIFCTPNQVISIEKDNGHGNVTRSDSFQVTLNHDLVDETEDSWLTETIEDNVITLEATGMDELVSSSLERKDCAQKLWDDGVQRIRAEHDDIGVDAVEEDDVVSWLKPPFEVFNDETHYSTVMDPRDGKILWRAQWLEKEFEWSEDESESAEVESDTEIHGRSESPYHDDTSSGTA
jgi:hypothetical protein